MRIGVDYRILAVGPSAATRGMPRYTQQQLREQLAAGTEHEYVLLCDPRADESLVLPEIRRAPNVRVALVPEEACRDVDDTARLLAKAEIFESWLAGLDLDLYHATTPFYLGQLVVPQHDACPYVATVYDLIPLIYPAQYLADPKMRDLYMLAATFVRRATRVLAISEAARRDTNRYLGVPRDRIDVATPIAEPLFRPLTDVEAEADLRGLRARLGLDGPYLLSVSDLHFTKNLETLIRGYALLPPETRTRLPLVVACHVSAEHEAYLGTLAERLGVAGQVRTTGLVSDAELVALYNRAELVVHPSRFEGFGLPVLEAMQCGTPVIATTAAAVPEVAGGAAVLVDPDDAPAFAAAMQALVADPDRRRELGVRGRDRAADHTGARLARATTESYVAAAGQRRPAGRVAMLGPLPEIEPYLTADVDLFVDDGVLPPLDLLQDHEARHFRALERLVSRYDTVVYHVGPGVAHRYLEGALRRFPGIAVLHGEIPARRLSEIVARTTAQIVSEPAAAARLTERHPGARPFVVPRGPRMVTAFIDVLERITGRRPGSPSWMSTPHEAASVGRSTPNVNLNKVCELEDFADPALVDAIDEVFAHRSGGGPPDRRHWEAAMAVRALRQCGVLRPDAVVLGAGARCGDAVFHLTRHVGRVVAVDRYLSPGAASEMLSDPRSLAPYEFDEGRLLVQHMDLRVLAFGDETFDAVFSTSSIEHAGDLDGVAAAAFEMGRVLKPGGVVSLSTELLLSGPPGGRGVPGTVLFSPEDLRRYVVEASGLEPVDDLRLEFSQSTLTSHGLLSLRDGYVSGTVHLALRKSEAYPASPNEWARPSDAIRRAVEEDKKRLVAAAVGRPAPDAAAEQHAVSVPAGWEERKTLAHRLPAEATSRLDVLERIPVHLVELHERVDSLVEGVESDLRLAAGCAEELAAILAGLEDMPTRMADLTYGATTACRDVHGAGWRWCPVSFPSGLSFGVMVDPAMGDGITEALLAGGTSIDWTTVMLMVDLVRPGDAVIDLGGYIGTFTLPAAAAGCRVLALEAAPRNAALLRASVARNAFDGVDVVNAVAGDDLADVAFFAEGPYGFVEFREDELAAGTLVVPSVTVDGLVEAADLGDVALVKIDVEGSELRALRGMNRLLGGAGAPPVLFESNGHTLQFYGARPADLLAAMEALGYENYLVDVGSVLRRVPPGQVQLQTVVDYLAVKGPLDRLQGWRVEGPLSVDERVARLVEECNRPSPYLTGQRAYVAQAVAGAEPEVLDHPDVVALLADLRADPSELVSGAAAWSETRVG